MRDIEFRAWNKILKRMFYDIQFDEYTSKNSEYPSKTFGKYIVDMNYVVMQYTGLKDENGKKIYESDIVEMNLEDTIIKGKIVYQGASFYIETIADLWEIDNYIYIKVLGNIYENKELLEE